MDVLYIWPDRPFVSLAAVWLASVVLLWAAREPALRVVEVLGQSLEEGLEALSTWCRETATRVSERAHAALLAAGELELRAKLDREFQGIDAAFAERLGQYSNLQRRLDDSMCRLDSDYTNCGESPPEVPGWSAAVETIASLPTSPDPNIQKILDGIRKSSREAEKKALASYREESARRHKILGGLAPHVKQIKDLLARMRDVVQHALETTERINSYADSYRQMQRDEEGALRAMTYSAVKLFCVSMIVLAIAAGGAFINFQLIALPMSELVPAGARIGGVPVSTVSALVIVLMETAVGIFIMDMLGITELFPRLSSLTRGRRRVILTVGLLGLFLLASVESSLAILREQIVEADAALKLSLAGPESAAIVTASTSAIPVVGQAVLGFILPWILAMVAIPLEMLLDSGRHVASSAGALVLSGLAAAARVVAHVLGTVFTVFPSLYDVYISPALRIERLARNEADVYPPPRHTSDTPVGQRGGAA